MKKKYTTGGDTQLIAWLRNNFGGSVEMWCGNRLTAKIEPYRTERTFIGSFGGVNCFEEKLVVGKYTDEN